MKTVRGLGVVGCAAGSAGGDGERGGDGGGTSEPAWEDPSPGGATWQPPIGRRPGVRDPGGAALPRGGGAAAVDAPPLLVGITE
eukprot:8595030-Pyramimonas_sp.AAC.1